jgi:hypothetical protein
MDRFLVYFVENTFHALGLIEPKGRARAST